MPTATMHSISAVTITIAVCAARAARSGRPLPNSLPTLVLAAPEQASTRARETMHRCSRDLPGEVPSQSWGPPTAVAAVPRQRRKRGGTSMTRLPQDARNMRQRTIRQRLLSCLNTALMGRYFRHGKGVL